MVSLTSTEETDVIAIWTALAIALGVVAGARYGADTRTDADPTGRDPAAPRGPVHHHTVRADLALLAALARRARAHRRAWELFDLAQRPWETEPRHL